MTNTVQKILSFYHAETPGVLSNLARILNHGYLKGTGKVVILPVDQGFEHGPIVSFTEVPAAYDPHYHFKLACESGCSAYAAPFGFLQAGAVEFAGQIPLILKVNNSSKLYKNEMAPIPALTSCVEDALSLGCSAVGFTIYPGSDYAHQMYEQVSKIASQAKKYGLVVVIWAYPRGRGVSKQGETAVDIVSYAAHIAAQLGAHIIKVKPPSDWIENPDVKTIFKKENISTKTLPDRVRLVIQSAFQGRRIVIFSGGPAKEEAAFIQEIQQLSQGGSFGSIVGRNAFKRSFSDACHLLKEVMDIYKNQK